MSDLLHRFVSGKRRLEEEDTICGEDGQSSSKQMNVDYEDSPRSASSGAEADVSNTEHDREPTPGAVEVWLELPDEIKFDPALAPFHQLYERQKGKTAEDSSLINHNESDLKQDGDLTAEQTKEDDGRNIFGGVDPAILQADDTHRLPRGQSVDDSDTKKPKKKWEKIGHIVKLSCLVVCWVLLTAALMIHNEREDHIFASYVKPHLQKDFSIPTLGAASSRILVTLKGPFAAEGELSTQGSTFISLWIQRSIPNSRNSSVLGVEKNSTIFYLPLQPVEKLDFSSGEERSVVLPVKDDLINELGTTSVGSDRNWKFTIWISSNSSNTVPLSLSFKLDPVDPDVGIIYAACLLCGLYVLIIFEIVNRTFAALFTSSMALAVLSALGERPPTAELLSWLDVETLLLLFSMMLLVSVLAETGVFDYLAVYAFKVTEGKIWPLINCLCFFTAIVSSFLDNVTTVLLMTPVTIRLCEVMELNPVPVLMAMVIYSNVGGTATPVGDPPNVIIASNAHVVKAGINFTTFTLHMAVGVLFVCVQTYFQLRFMFRDMSKLRHSAPQEIQELRQEILVWKRAAASLAGYSKDEGLVRDALHRKTKRLTAQLRTRTKHARAHAVPADTFRETLYHLEQKYKIRDPVLLIKASVAVTFVVMVFFLHAIPELQKLSLGWTALLGALLLLALADHEDLEPVLARVEWSTLLFFAALFILMEALSKLGLIQWIGSLTEAVILSVNEEARLAVAILLLLWVSAIASAFVDNIPLTTMMVRVATSLGDNPALGLPLQPLIWALSFGACLGGNGTLIGASANVVCAGVAEQHGYRFTFIEFFKVGFPIMLGSVAVVSVYLLVCHCAFSWHPDY